MSVIPLRKVEHVLPCTMKSSVWFMIVLCTFVSCKEAVPPPEPLDPALVAMAGEHYKDYIVEEIKPAESDTIQMLAFDTTHFAFDLKPRQKQINHRFLYKNIGSEQSYIQHLTSACNCMTDNSEKEILNPGDSNELNITFDPGLWEPGESKSLYVFTKHFPHQVEFIIERNK